MTLIELTVVITVLLSLISGALFAAQAWKSGSDRAACILNIRNFQLAARSYQNMNNLKAGVDAFEPSMIIGENKMIPATPVCPASGVYSYAPTFVEPGAFFLDCDIAGHEPDPSARW